MQAVPGTSAAGYFHYWALLPPDSSAAGHFRAAGTAACAAFPAQKKPHP